MAKEMELLNLGKMILDFENTKRLPISMASIAEEKLKMHRLEHSLLKVI
jgi:hypothetical protein